MNKQQIIKTLQSGISEITYTDSHSVEHSLIATMAPQHLPDNTTTPKSTHNHNIMVFNVNSEKWQSILTHTVINIEQLTGKGAAVNEKKLKASPEYMEQLELFSDEDFDTMEHPEL